MNLTGGIDEYSLNSKRHKSDTPPLGRKVRFLNENGRDSELEEAQQIFKPYQILTVEEIYVGGWHSEVTFLEVDGLYNTVMFEDVEVEE